MNTENNKEQVPVIKATKVERVQQSDGRVDIVVHVPRLAMKSAYAAHKERMKSTKEK